MIAAIALGALLLGALLGFVLGLVKARFWRHAGRLGFVAILLLIGGTAVAIGVRGANDGRLVPVLTLIFEVFLLLGMVPAYLGINHGGRSEDVR